MSEVTRDLLHVIETEVGRPASQRHSNTDLATIAVASLHHAGGF